MKSRRRVLAGSLVVVILAVISSGGAATPAQAASVNRVVDSGAVDCTGVTDTMLSTALAAVGTGPGTITVCSGSYFEKIVLNGAKSVKIIGKPGATLMPNFAPYNDSMINITGSTSITIQGLTIDGTHSVANAGSNAAINVYNSSVTIKGNTITGWRELSLTPGPINTQVYGIFVGNQGKKVTIDSNTILDFQGIGILVTGPGSLSITNNVINATSANSAWPPTGLMVSGNPKGGKITGNWIASDSFPTYTNGSSALSVYASNKMSITKNNISNWDFGIGLQTSCGNTVDDANHNTISMNTLVQVAYGIQLSSWANGCDAHADYNKVTKNTITDTGLAGTKGITVDSYDVDPNNPPVATTLKATVTGNTVTLFNTPLDFKFNNGGKLTGKFSPNTVLP